jgi:phosphatidylserine/phosphatidylglycerophosphate/cardiolipin synthase-like enzyme
MKPQVNIYASSDEIVLVWHYDAPLPNCLGFAIYRCLAGQSPDVAEPIANRIGFADQVNLRGELRPSTEWPIQRFLWVEHRAGYRPNSRYKIVPMLAQPGSALLHKDEANASDWTAEVSVDTGAEYQAYFNRGLISSQFFYRLSQRLVVGPAQRPHHKPPFDPATGYTPQVNQFLGGRLVERLLSLLDEVARDPTLTLYAALYELHAQVLVDKLAALQGRAQVLLANGAIKAAGEDKNQQVRQELTAAGVLVHDRLVGPGHFAHNKFLVLCRDGQPERVWTGSTNWTASGLYTQVNNGLLIHNAALAAQYLAQWQQLVAAGNDYPAELAAFNRAPRTISPELRAWFSPTQQLADLHDVEQLLAQAQAGVLFLMFNPGPHDTVFNKILELQQVRPDFFVHGVMNQDPGGKDGLISFIRPGKNVETNWSAILPKSVATADAFWFEELTPNMVTIHSKVLVIDPFGATPYVVTGSHNLGPKASRANDENLLIIQDRQLAQEYAVAVTSVYEHYRWRYSLFEQNADFKGLTRDPNWMQHYLASDRYQELLFWMGNRP